MSNWSVKIKILITICLVTGMNMWLKADIVLIEKPSKSGFLKHNSRRIDAVIIHSVFNNSGGDLYNVDSIVKQFSRYHVSTHYLIATLPIMQVKASCPTDANPSTAVLLELNWLLHSPKHPPKHRSML
jgi:hypothetical protein